MIYRLDPDYLGFPDPEEANPDGLLAIGGDLSPQRLVNAYCQGIFPWPCEGEPLLWFSLDPRMVLRLDGQEGAEDGFRCSKSLRRTVRSGRFEVRIDTCFEEVMRHCAAVERVGQEGTWITPEMIEAYTCLHRLGLAHSFETFRDGRLVGGLYGVSVGPMFCGESMFHLERDASKVAFVRLVDFCRAHGFKFIDAQQETAHLASLGARPMSRKDYLALLATLDFSQTLMGKWSFFS